MSTPPLNFFRFAPLGYAPAHTAGVYDSVELGTDAWHLRPLQVDDVSSSFFDDPARFAAGTALVDSAFLMSGLAATWHPQPKLVAATIVGRPQR